MILNREDYVLVIGKAANSWCEGWRRDADGGRTAEWAKGQEILKQKIKGKENKGVKIKKLKSHRSTTQSKGKR